MVWLFCRAREAFRRRQAELVEQGLDPSRAAALAIRELASAQHQGTRLSTRSSFEPPRSSGGSDSGANGTREGSTDAQHSGTASSAAAAEDSGVPRAGGGGMASAAAEEGVYFDMGRRDSDASMSGLDEEEEAALLSTIAASLEEVKSIPVSEVVSSRPGDGVEVTTAEQVLDVVSECVRLSESSGGEEDGNPWRAGVQLIVRVFSSPELLANAFVRRGDCATEEDLPAASTGAVGAGVMPTPAMTGASGTAVMPDLALGEAASSVRSAAAAAGDEEDVGRWAPATSVRSGLNMMAVRQVYESLAEHEALMDALQTGHVILVERMQSMSTMQLKTLGERNPHELRPLWISLASPVTLDVAAYDSVYYNLMDIVAQLGDRATATLVEWASRLGTEEMENMVGAAQTFYTVRFMDDRPLTTQEAYRPALLLDVLNKGNELHYRRHGRRIVPFPAFYNEPMSERLDMQAELHRWLAARDGRRGEDGRLIFSFCSYPFILDAGAKETVLSIEARLSQIRQARSSAMDMLFNMGGMGNISPHLIIKVRRDNVVDDTIQAVSGLVARQDAALKKPLRIEFEGEEGLDAGGVKREFFQVMVRSLFVPEYGMFVEEEDTRFIWFRAESLNSPIEWEMVGVLVGLAIYNGVILDVNFPLVVYRKLKGEPLSIRDLCEFRPDVGRSLLHLLEFDEEANGASIEDTFCLDFTVATTEWDSTVVHELVPGGADKLVTAENRQEYVDKYIHFILEDHVAKHFDRFRKGFMSVAGGPALSLFRAEELQLLVTGSPELDFDALEEAAVYDDGYDEDHAIIRGLWTTVHSLSPEEKRKFLAFCTGSDRAPVRGLGSLELKVTRMGPDSEQLPTAHTCFNHLLIPEYSSLEKLQDKLRKAIAESEGFGLI